MRRRLAPCRIAELLKDSGCGLEPLEQRSLLAVTSGLESLLNTWITDVQATSSPAVVASDDAGGFVAVWESRGQDAAGSYGVYGRRFGVSGAALGSEFRVNTTVLADQRAPSVAMNGAGAFVVVWEGEGTLGSGFSGIYVQRYDASGAAIGTEIGVAGAPELAVSRAAVAMNASGAFVVVWEENGSHRDVAARIYDASGSPVGDAFRVNQTAAGNQFQPQVVIDDAGNFVVTWDGNGAGDDAGVFARMFGADGAPLTDETLINTTTTNAQSYSAIARDGNGEFVVAWSGFGAGDMTGVYVRRLSSAGAPMGGEILVNSSTLGTQQRPSIDFDTNGDYVVAWSGQGGPDTSGVYAREFWSDDTPKGADIAMNSTVAGAQANASVASIGDNRYIVAWSGAGAGDAAGVFRRLLVNQTPTLSVSAGFAEYTEDGVPLPIDAGLEVRDADSLLASATVRISANYAIGEDALVFEDQLGITGSWDAASATLTLTGVAPASDYQAALRSVAFWNSSNNPSTATRTVAFSVSDGAISSPARTRMLIVTPNNDAPVVTMSGGSAAFTQGGGPVVIDPGVMVSDVDSETIWGALIQITGNYVEGQDELLFEDTPSIFGSWDAPSGTLLLVGFGTFRDYEAALRSVMYSNSAQEPSTAVRTVSFEVSDGALPSVPASRSVSIILANRAPEVAGSGAGVAYVEDGAPVALDPGLGVSDADSAMLAGATVVISGNYAPGEDALVFVDQAGISGSWDPATGTLTLTGAASIAAYEAALRSVAYVNHSQNPSGLARVVTMSVSDGEDWSASISLLVSVMPVNDAPSAASSAGRATFTQGGAAIIVDAGVMLSDADSPTLEGAIVRIDGYVAGEDELLFADQGGIRGAWDAGSGVLTLSGTASVAAYEAALRSVAYRNPSSNPSAGVRVVTMVVADSSGAASEETSREVEVVAVPPPPPPPPPPSDPPGKPKCHPHKPPVCVQPPVCKPVSKPVCKPAPKCVIVMPPPAKCGVKVVMPHCKEAKVKITCGEQKEKRHDRCEREPDRGSKGASHDRDRDNRCERERDRDRRDDRCERDRDDRHDRDRDARDHRNDRAEACPGQDRGRGGKHGRG